MCRRITCERCGKPSFAGCGMHVEQVLANVPREQRCRCHEVAKPSTEGGASSASQPAKRKAWPWLF
jgi:hypothetical protein